MQTQDPEVPLLKCPHCGHDSFLTGCDDRERRSGGVVETYSICAFCGYEWQLVYALDVLNDRTVQRLMPYVRTRRGEEER